jgi:hypothetical protein
MTTKKAIEILTKQRDKIDDINYPNDETWVYQTAEYIRQFFGENSTQFSYINRFSFSVLATNYDSKEAVRQWMAQKPRDAKQFLNNCIEDLKHTGLYKKPSVNILSKLSDTALWTIIPFTLTTVFTGGFLLGQYLTDIKNIELRQELTKCKNASPNTITAYPNDNSIIDTVNINQKNPELRTTKK